jgi:hypothetical protein
MTVLDGPGDSFASLVFDSTGLRQMQEQARTAFLRTARESVRSVAKSVERDLEAATEASGLGRLAKAWNSTVYPKAGLAAAPTATIYPKGKTRTLGAILAYSQGARIKGTRGQFLAVPLPAAGQKRIGRGGAPLTPGEWERRTGLRLRFVFRRGRPSLLVLDEAVLRGKRRVAGLNTERRRATGRGNTTIPIFVLLPQVNVKKRFDIPSVTAGAADRLAADFRSRIDGLIAQLNQPQG